MKTIKFFGVLLLAGATVVSSCKKDDDKLPNIAVTGGMAEAAPGEDVTYTVTVGSEENKLSKLEVSSSVNGSTPGKIWDTTFSSATNTSVDYVYTLGSSLNNGDKIELTFKVTDSKELTNSSKQTITVKFTAGDINTYSATLLGSQSNPTEGSFFATSNGTVYNQADAKTNSSAIDFLYFYGVANEATIAAPNDADAATIYNNGTTGLQTWTKKNATMFKTSTMTAAEFDLVLNDGAIVSASTGASASKAHHLAVGNVVAFKTEAGKSGVFKVTKVEGANTATGSITIDVKVQK